MAEQSMPNPRALKIVVIAMGVLLIVGFAVVIAVTIYRIKHPKAEPVLPPRALAADLAPDGTVERVVLDGNRLVLELHDGQGRRIVVFDLGKGRASDVIRLGPAPAAVP